MDTMTFFCFVLFSFASTIAFAFPQIKKPRNGFILPVLCSQPPKAKAPLAELYPEYLEILRVLDPVGTASLPKMKFLTEEWKTNPNNEIIGSDLFGYGLIYEFAKEVEENETVKNEHEAYCANFSKHLLRSFNVPLTSIGSGVEQELLSGQGKVLLFASLDKFALRTEILGFLSNDPYVKLGYLSNWMLLERNEIISYIKDWYVLQLSYKKLLGEVERLDRQEVKRKPWIPSQNKNRRHMNDNNGNFYNSGFDVDEYDSSTDEGYDYKYGKQKRENEVKKEKRK